MPRKKDLNHLPKLSRKPEELVFDSLIDFLDFRVERHNMKKSCGTGKQERELCDLIEMKLKLILQELGFKVLSVVREFSLIKGRADFLVCLGGQKYIVIEVKSSKTSYNPDLEFSYAIGQVLTYKSSLIYQYDIKKENIIPMIITDQQSDTLISTIINNGLDVECLFIHKKGSKYYGRER